ncbi:MAG: hypothetical protein ABIT20_08420 [Gemmatimonadaceae bacterium]
MRPNPLIARAYLTRGAWLWIGARLLASAVIALSNTNPLDFSLTASLLIVAISTALGIVDVARRHERALLENLGVSRLMLLAFFAGPALLGELGIALAAVARR